MSRTGMELIKISEGFRAKAYLCPAGIPTIGYGETQGVHLGMTTTIEEAQAKLDARYDEFEAEVLSVVKVDLNENQLGALTSFTYNIGLGNLSRSGLLARINRGDFEGAAEEFKKWNMGGGRVLPGLVIRRQAEHDLFVKPVE